MPAPLPCRILIGPLSPTLELEGGRLLTSSSLSHDLCLGAYLRHPQLRPFYLHPELLLQPGQQARPLAPGSLCFGGRAGWSVRELLAQAEDFRPELLIWWGFHYALPADIANCPLPTLLIVSDWHYHYSAVRDYVEAFDHVLCDRKLEACLKVRGLSHAQYWPAYGFDPGMMHEHPVAQRDIDICFLGNTNPATYPERNRLLRRIARLGQRYRVLIRKGIGHPDYARTLSRSRIVFNHTLRGEMNLRAYEAAACGALLLMESENLEIRDFLSPGRECLLYEDDNLEALIDAYLGNEPARAAIAAAGQARIQAFSYERQFEALLALLPALLARPPRPRKAPVGMEALLLEARQLVTTDVPALRARALALLETSRPAPRASQPLPERPLNALAVLRLDYQELIQASQSPGLYQSLTSLPALLDDMADLARRGDVTGISNLAWLAFLLRDWSRLELALGLLGPALTGSVPLDPTAFWLPLRYTPLHNLRQRALQQFDAGSGSLDYEWLRLLRWSAQYLAGNLALARQRLPAAAEAFAAACQLGPELAEGWFELSRCRQALGQPEQAAAALAAGIAQGVFYPGAWLGLLPLLSSLGRHDEARALQAEAAVLFQDPSYRLA